jgi:hypothetical protein
MTDHDLQDERRDTDTGYRERTPNVLPESKRQKAAFEEEEETYRPPVKLPDMRVLDRSYWDEN